MEKKNKEKSFPSVGINWFPGHMAKTKREIKEKLNLIDIVYEVIDARMPISSKILDINDLIKDKMRILVVTKYDLCDKLETDKILKKSPNDGLGMKTDEEKMGVTYKQIAEYIETGKTDSEAMKNIEISICLEHPSFFY